MATLSSSRLLIPSCQTNQLGIISFCRPAGCNFESGLQSPPCSETSFLPHGKFRTPYKKLGLNLKKKLHMMAPRSALVDSPVAGKEGSDSSSGQSPAKLTYLEGNSWLWDIAGVQILIDPVIVGNLDFGIPWLYDAAKRVTGKIVTLDNLPKLDYLLLTQSLDDHCHKNTLAPLAEMQPNLPVIATPNAEPILKTFAFRNVRYLEPGQSVDVKGANGAEINIKATVGPVLGPPWQRPENGYIVRSTSPKISVYLEPHCVFTPELEQEQADVVVTPVVKQVLPAFTLVSGQEDAVRLAKVLKAKYVVPMANGELDAKGILSLLVKSQGTAQSFQDLLSKELPGAQVLNPTPNEPVSIPSLEN